MTPRDHCQVRSTSSLSSSKYNDDMAMESSKRRSTGYARFPLENFGLPSWTFRYISTIFRSVKPEWFYHLHSGRKFLGINGKQPTSHRKSYRQMVSNLENTALREKRQNQRFLPEKKKRQ